MFLKRIEILNYRQLSHIVLDLQKDLTVLAGPNNSGKTTLISVLKGIFNDNKLAFLYSDIPTNLSVDWVDKIMPIFKSIMVSNAKETGVSEIIKAISIDDQFSSDYIIDEFQAKIEVEYIPETDDIQNFVDYLMDLDESKHSFYFVYTYKPKLSAFEKLLNERYDKIKSRIEDVEKPDCKEKDTKIYFIKEELLKLYSSCLAEKCFYCNSEYKNPNPIELSEFKKLFNFENIDALRKDIDDNDRDSSKGISKRVIALLKNDESWIATTKKLPDMLLESIDVSGAKAEMQNSSIKSLDTTIQEISKTSGGHIGKLQLEMDVDEADVDEFIKRITRAKYDIDGLLLNENSQGLGFSNLIYLHMRLEEFYKTIDNKKVNVFFIEEPESHMHPQMQNVFIRFLKKYYTDKKLQGLITTHSNEIARSVGLHSLRVMRQTGKSTSELFDLSEFRKTLAGKTVSAADDETTCLLENFYDWFFEIGYSELIFADKVILYEGDTERLYIRKLLNLTEFSSLCDNYIAYIQVGGAYAFNYFEILKRLKIKSLIITDLDYEKSASTFEAAKQSTSTNATINNIYKLIKTSPGGEEVSSPTIDELYKLQSLADDIVIYDLICIVYQDENSTARTMEEAMLAKLLNHDVFKLIKRSEWKKIRKDNKLHFSIPNNKDGEEDSEFSIRRIVKSTENSKTDFMYSVILSGNEEKLLPEYIRKGLLWLVKQ